MNLVVLLEVAVSFKYFTESYFQVKFHWQYFMFQCVPSEMQYLLVQLMN